MTCKDGIRRAREKNCVPTGTLGTKIKPTPFEAVPYGKCHSSAWLQNSMCLTKRQVWIGQMADSERANDGVKRAPPERECFCIRLFEPDSRMPIACQPELDSGRSISSALDQAATHWPCKLIGIVSPTSTVATGPAATLRASSTAKPDVPRSTSSVWVISQPW